MTDRGGARPRRLDERYCNAQRQPADGRLDVDNQLHRAQQQQAAHHARKRLGRRAVRIQPADNLSLGRLPAAERKLGIVEQRNVRSRYEARGDAEHELERCEPEKAIGHEQNAVPDSGKHGTNDERSLAAEEIGKVARRHLADENDKAKKRL